MAPTYNCTLCNEVFENKIKRDNHIRGECLTFVRVTDMEGHIKQIERAEGKFGCFGCLKKFKYSNKLTAHWKRCMINDGTRSDCSLRL